MTIEEVIEIAKKLRPDTTASDEFYFAQLWPGMKEPYRLKYLSGNYSGDSWESALYDAGWNGANFKPKTRKSTRSKTGWEG